MNERDRKFSLGFSISESLRLLFVRVEGNFINLEDVDKGRDDIV